MADEITLSATLRILKGDFDFSRKTGSVSQTMTGDALVHNVQLIGDTHEALAMGDVTIPGAFMFINLSTFTIQIGIDDTGVFVPFITIPASGGFFMGSALAVAAPYAKASDSEGAYLEYAIAQA